MRINAFKMRALKRLFFERDKCTALNILNSSALGAHHMVVMRTAERQLVMRVVVI